MRTQRVLALFFAVAVAGAACGGGSDDAATTTTEAPEVEETTTTEARAPADAAAAEAEVRANFATYFDSETPEADALALAEDVDEIIETLRQAQGASPGGHRTVAVKSVTFTSETTADVTFDIVLDGNVLLPDFAGSAVLDEGVWKISRKTNCDLSALAGFSCPEPAEASTTTG